MTYNLYFKQIYLTFSVHIHFINNAASCLIPCYNIKHTIPYPLLSILEIIQSFTKPNYLISKFLDNAQCMIQSQKKNNKTNKTINIILFLTKLIHVYSYFDILHISNDLTILFICFSSSFLCFFLFFLFFLFLTLSGASVIELELFASP